MEICSGCAQQRVARRICCGKRVPTLVRCNSGSMSSQSSSYIGYVSTTLDDCFRTQDQMVSDRLRSLAASLSASETCIWLPKYCYPLEISLWDYVVLQTCAWVLARMVTLRDYSGWNPLFHMGWQLLLDSVAEVKSFAEVVAYQGRKDWLVVTLVLGLNCCYTLQRTWTLIQNWHSSGSSFYPTPLIAI